MGEGSPGAGAQATSPSLGPLVVLISTMAVVTSLFFTALAPLLPWFEEELGLSKAQAGLLVAMYPIGLSAAVLPVSLAASRVGVKRLALASMVVLAATSVIFGLAQSYDALLVSRLFQGAAAGVSISSGLAWIVTSAPRERRAELIGLTSGARSAGQVLGPIVGATAVVVGRAGTFLVMATAAVVVAVVGGRFQGPPVVVTQSLARLRHTASLGRLAGGHWIIIIPGLLLGNLAVLAPLQLDRLGWGPTGVAATFLVAASIGVLARPWVGRWADRFGLLRAIGVLLLLAAPLTALTPWMVEAAALALCVVCASTLYGVIIGPGMALVSHMYEEAGVAHAVGFAVMVLAGAAGLAIGAAVGGGIADAVGDKAAYGSMAVACVLTAVAIRSSRVVRT